MPTYRERTFGDVFGDNFGLFEPDPRPTPFPPRTTVPFEIVVYDKAFKRRGWVGAYQSLTVNVRHNAVSTAEFVVLITHPRIPDLMAAGCRVVMNYDGAYLLSGTVESNSISEADGTITFSVQSDFAKLTQMLGWPVPTTYINDQGSSTSDYVLTGPAETVVKKIVAVNADRLGEPITIAPDQGRGDTVTVFWRMNPLTDKMYPVIDQAGVGVDLRQSGSGWRLDCYTPTVRKRVLSQSSGVVVDATASLTNPTVTRVVVGGQGVGTARAFIQIVNAPMEAKYGFIREAFVDARDVDTLDLMVARGKEALAAGVETYGFSMSLAENEAFRYGRTIKVGDIATYAIDVPKQAPILITDVCRLVTVTHNPGEPVTVTPSLGDPNAQDPTSVIISAIQRLNAKFRKVVL